MGLMQFIIKLQLQHSMKHIIILGGGRVGSAMAHDLSKNYSVTVVDINEELLQKLKHQIQLQKDLKKKH